MCQELWSVLCAVYCCSYPTMIDRFFPHCAPSPNSKKQHFLQVQFFHSATTSFSYNEQQKKREWNGMFNIRILRLCMHTKDFVIPIFHNCSRENKYSNLYKNSNMHMEKNWPSLSENEKWKEQQYSNIHNWKMIKLLSTQIISSSTNSTDHYSWMLTDKMCGKLLMLSIEKLWKFYAMKIYLCAHSFVLSSHWLENLPFPLFHI